MYAHDVCVLLAFASAEVNVFSVGREPNDWLSRIRNARLRPWRIYALGPFKDCSHKRNINGFEAQSLRMLPGIIPYHLGSSRKLGMTQGNIISWKRIIGQPVTRFISGKRCFSHYKNVSCPHNGIHGGVSASPPVRDREERTRVAGCHRNHISCRSMRD